MEYNQIQLQDYTVHLDRRIGSGGQSSVYEANKGSTKYAAKRIMDKPIKDMLDSELLIYQKDKTHRNVIKIVDFCQWEHGNSVWIFTEFCQHGSLNDYFKKHPDQFRDSKFQLDIMLQISAGLKFLHELNMIHRDIKPSNCLLTEEDGQIIVKISDFGVSRDNVHTSTKTVIGTEEFYAPELWPLYDGKEKKYNAKVDTFALGLTFLAMIQQTHVPKIKGLKKSLESLSIGHLMYMRREDGDPPVTLVIDDPADNDFVITAKDIIREATLVDPAERSSAEYIYQKLTALAAKIVSTYQSHITHITHITAC